MVTISAALLPFASGPLFITEGVRVEIFYCRTNDCRSNNCRDLDGQRYGITVSTHSMAKSYL